MKKYTKQIIALLLAACSLMSFAMPTVFATQDAQVPERESVTYQFYKEEWKDSSVSARTAKLKADYDAGDSNWRFETASTAYQFSRGGNKFTSGIDSLEYLCGTGNWIAVRIKSPGAGNFDLTFTHGVWNQGALEGKVFIVDAAMIDAAVGEKAAEYADAIAADVSGATEAFNAYKNAVAAAIVGQDSVMNPSYYAASSRAGVTETGSFRFEAEKEYVVVFTSETMASGATTARVLLSSLTATYSENQEQPSEPTTYEFFNGQWANSPVSAHTAELKTAYDAGNSNWRFEVASTAYQFAKGGNKFTSGIDSLEYLCGTGNWIAVRIKSPGAGKFDLTFTHGVWNQGALEGKVFIVDAALIDAAVGEKAAEYADAIAADVSGATEAFDAYKNAVAAAIAGQDSVINPSYYAAKSHTGVTETGSFRFEAEKEYVIVFKSEKMAEGATTARVLLSSLTATYAANQEDEELPTEATEPSVAPEAAYTDGLYDFLAGAASGDTLADGIEDIAAKYDAGVLNWKYETHSGMRLDKTTYESGTRSLRFVSTATWWVAFRIKAPEQSGSYNIQMTHGAGGQGASAGEIFVISGDTATKDIPKVMNRKGAAMTTDWFYGETTNDWIAGRQSTVGTVNMEAGKEYIVIFLPTANSKVSKNGYIWLGQLQATRVGDLVPEEESAETADAGFYEFYHWDYPGEYLIHYRTEEELGKKIVHEEIAQEYKDGKINWTYEKSNGYASFSTGTPYLDTMIGETNYFVLRVKAPGTGTYSIEYTHYATTDAKAGDYGYVYIVPMPANKTIDYNYIKDECNFKEPIITTSYKADKNGFATVTGTYTSFKEDQEFLICFSVADKDNSKKDSLRAYPQSMKMTRIGDYQPEPGTGADDGIVYNLFREEYANKNLWRSGDRAIYDELAQRFNQGSANVKLEGIAGSAYYTNKDLTVGVDSDGGAVAFRVKAPGTGKYQVTLKYFLSSDSRAADSTEVYIVEAPAETLTIQQVADKMARAPMMTMDNRHDGVGMKKASDSGTYSFQEGKEYYVILYLVDAADTDNQSGSCWTYLDKLVMKRVGEFEPEPEHFTIGGIAVKDPVSLFRTADALTITEVNGHDYLTISIFGSTMMIYNIDEWRLVDEVYTGIATPRGVCVDPDGRTWLSGDAKMLFCYDPFTQTSFQTKNFMKGGSTYQMTCGEDGYLYVSTSADTGGYVYRIDPKTQEYTEFYSQPWSKYIGDLAQMGDYIYMVASGEQRHEVWKMNKSTGKIVSTLDVTKEMLTTRYVTGMGFLDENYLFVNTSAELTIVDVRTMEKLTTEQIGLEGAASRELSGEIDGKRYFVISKEGLCYYDIATQTFGTMGGELKNARTGVRGKDCNLATIDDSRLPGTSIITYGGMTADGLNLYAYNPQSKACVTLIGLVETSFAYGQSLRSIGQGLPGSGDLYFGANYDAPVQVYNTQKKELMQEFSTNGQADVFHWYKDQLYIGNYNGAILTRMEGNQAIPLFRLNNDSFYQARIHSITSGDDKVFVGTVPHVYQNGGVIAWYDLNTELTYVVTGPNPEDVYYAKSSKVTVTNEWYSAVTHELVDMEKEWNKDEDGDGVCRYFKGPIPLQSITKVIYRDGLLFGLAAPMGGSSSVTPAGESAKMFVYDVEAMKMIKVVDIGDHISGLPYPLASVASFVADPDISNKFWGVVSETLFSMTYDRDTNKMTFKEELSFSKNSFKTGTGWFTNDILFQGEDMYVMFYKIGGLCRVNRNNTKEYEQLLYNFNSVSEIPGNMALGEDGDLYYTSGTNLYVLNLDITEEEKAEAQNVQDLISLISDEVTLADRAAIEAARAAWDAMAPANQPMVKNFAKLEEAEVDLLRLRIADLGEITLEDEAELVAIRKTYSTLTLDQRMTIDFLSVSKAESIMSILRGERMVKMIDAIGEVTLEKEAVVRDARAAFMALTLYERRLVTNIDVLNAAEAVLTTLLLQKSEAGAVDALIEKIGFVFYGDGAKVSAARKAYNKLDDGAKALVEKHGALVAAEIILVAEYVLLLAAAICSVLYAIPVTRTKIFKKKEKVTEE